MSSKDKILRTVEGNQPPPRELPEVGRAEVGRAEVGRAPKPEGRYRSDGEGRYRSDGEGSGGGDLADTFINTLESIGGEGYIVPAFDRIVTILRERHPGVRRVISGCPELGDFGEPGVADVDPHTLEDVDLAVLRAHFGVAENGSCWITEDRMIVRALPFITQHLALVIRREDIVPDMHAAYERVAALDEGAGAGAEERAGAGYGFATFIAGPSKTADIEQSLVLGAHGPKSLIVFLLEEGMWDEGFY